MADEISKPVLTYAQRIAACKIIEGEINKGNSGLTAEAWTTAAKGAYKPGVGISVYQDGKKFAQLTISAKGFNNVKNYLTSTPPEVLAKLEQFGFTPGQFSETLEKYDSPMLFDTSKLAK